MGWRILQEGIKFSLCECSCGLQKLVDTYSVKHEYSKSCISCGNTQMRKAVTHKYGKSHRFYFVARGIVKRVNSQTDKAYTLYNPKGIYEEWQKDPKVLVEFLESLWESQYGHSNYSTYGTGASQVSIDRINNDKGYFPDNLHFASKQEQCRNSRRW